MAPVAVTACRARVNLDSMLDEGVERPPEF
jgi:hypothetical protein